MGCDLSAKRGSQQFYHETRTFYFDPKPRNHPEEHKPPNHLPPLQLSHSATIYSMGTLEPTSIKVAKFIIISGRYFLPAEFLGFVYFTDQTGSVFIIASFCVYKKYYRIYTFTTFIGS